MRQLLQVSILALCALFVVYFLSIEGYCVATTTPNPVTTPAPAPPSPPSPPSPSPSQPTCPTPVPCEPKQPEQQPVHQPVQQPKQPKQLACAKPIQQYIATHGEYFDPAVRVDTMQTVFYDTLNSQPVRFKDPQVLQERINNFSKCQNKTYNAQANNTSNYHLPNLAICSFQSSTSTFVQEWLIHYTLLGENAAHEALHRALEAFVTLGLVEEIPWKGKNQGDALAACMQRVAGNHDWVSFLDADEYITFNNDDNCIPEFLFKFSAEHISKPVGTIAMRWRNMATDGAPMHNTSKTLYEQENYEPLPHQKIKKHLAFINGITSYIDIHTISVKQGYWYYNTNGELLKEGTPWFKDPESGVGVDVYNNIELRHYWGLSLEYLLYDKLCGGLWERRNWLEKRISMALTNFQKDTTKVQMAGPHKHEKMLNEFMFGN